MQTNRTSDTNRLAPHPGMTDDELVEFEAWAKEVEGHSQVLEVAKCVAYLTIAWAVFIIALVAFN